MNKLTVYYRAPVLTQSGYGVQSRQLLDYLLSDDRFIVFCESVNWGSCGFIHELNFQDKDKLKKYYESIARWDRYKNQIQQYDLAIHCTIPNEVFRKGNLNILYTAGIEVDRVSLEWIKKCNSELDMVIVPSKHSAKTLAGTVYTIKNEETNEIREEKLNVPLFVIPEWFDKPKEIKVLDFKFETDKNFLCVGQWGNKGVYGEERKDIANLVKTFIETFKDNSKVGLILKIQTINGCVEDKFHTQKKLQQIKANFKNVECKIYLLHQELTEEEMWGLYHHPQVSALVHFGSEGFGLPLIEASAAGIPVIAVNWSGHLDFLRHKNGFIPLKYELKQIPECQVWNGVLEKESKWARVDLVDAKKQMRKFFDSPSLIKKQAKENVKWLEDNFSKEAISKKWKEFFDSFIKENNEEIPAQYFQYQQQKQSLIDNLKELIQECDKQKVLYIMPQSAGDCLISTAIVHSLICSRHWDTDFDFYIATQEPYKPLFDKLVKDFGVKVIDYKPEMINSELTKEVWDYVYNPGINVQYQFSNWLGAKEYSVRLLEEFAKHCNLSPQEITNYQVKVTPCDLPDSAYIVIAPAGSKGNAKQYKYWKDVVSNLKQMLPNVEMVQIGTLNEELINGCLDYRGKPYDESFFIIKNAYALVGVDSFPAHAAAAMETPHVVLYGSTDAHNCAPLMIRKKVPQLAIETNECEKRCYKDDCMKMKEGKNCLSRGIEPQTVCLTVQRLIEKIQKGKEDENLDCYC